MVLARVNLHVVSQCDKKIKSSLPRNSQYECELFFSFAPKQLLVHKHQSRSVTGDQVIDTGGR